MATGADGLLHGDDFIDAAGSSQQALLLSSRAMVGIEKENRAPASASARTARKVPVSARPQSPAPGQASPPVFNSEVSVSSKPKSQDLRWAAELDSVREELHRKTHQNKELLNQMRAKDKKADEYQRKVEELMAERNEMGRRAQQLENDRVGARKQCFEKDQEISSLQKRLETLKQASDLHRRATDEQRSVKVEIQKLRESNDAYREQVSSLNDRTLNLDRARFALEESVRKLEQEKRQDQRSLEDARSSLKEKITILEEQLNLECSRRTKLEARLAIETAECEQNRADRTEERQKYEELQRSSRLLEVQLKACQTKEHEQVHRALTLEDDLTAAKAKLQATAAALLREEQHRQELEQRAAKTEVTLQATVRDLAAERSKLAQLQEEYQNHGLEQHTLLSAKVESAEKRAAALASDLADERDRCESLEQRTADLEEKVRVFQQAADDARRVAVGDREYQLLEKRALDAEAEVRALEDNQRRWLEYKDQRELAEALMLGRHAEEIQKITQDVKRDRDQAIQDAQADWNKCIDKLKSEKAELELKLTRASSGLSLEAAQQLKEQEKQLQEQATKLAIGDGQLQDFEAELRKARKEIGTLQASLSSSQEELAKLQKNFSEESLELEARVSRAEVAATAAIEQRDRLRSEALASRGASEALEIRQLKEDMASATALVKCYRWRLLAEDYAQRHSAEQTNTVLARLRQIAVRWRRVARSHQFGADRTLRQEEELERLDAECETLREQNCQVLQSFQQQQQDLQITLAELSRLQEREAAYESDVLRLSDQTTQLLGHNNHKQKIKHLESLKNESNALRQELKRAKQQIAQTEAQLRSANFFEVAATGPASEHAGRSRTPGRRQTGPMTPGPTTPGRADKAARDPLAALADDRKDRAEQLRHARAHRRASERAMTEYHHLYALIENILGGAPKGSSSAADFSPGASTPVHSSEAGIGKSDLKASEGLYRKLRELASSVRHAPALRGSLEDNVKTPRPDKASPAEREAEASWELEGTHSPAI